MTAIQRSFRYNGIVLPDPNPREEDLVAIRRQLAVSYPAISNAKIDGPDFVDGEEVYTLRAQTGTNG